MIDVSSVSGRLAGWLAEGRGRTVVLPDGPDQRTVDAALILAASGLVPVLVGPRGPIESMLSERREADRDPPARWPMPEIIDPEIADHGPIAARLIEGWPVGPGGALEVEEADRLARDPLYHAGAMLALGRADACVGGASTPSPDVLRCSLRTVGVRSGEQVSSCYLMAMPDGRLLGFGDCVVVPHPDVEQLARIAIACARTYATLTHELPRVAMLSFSTHGSARHPSVEAVQAATARVRELAPELDVDGELQFDAAISPVVAHMKAPASAIAGNANVFVFPNLDAGNIGYKITERLAGARALGPVIQGIARPFYDISRGCSAEDIVALAAMAAVLSLRDGAQPSEL